MPWNGEYSYELIKKALLKYLGMAAEKADAAELPPLPVRPPVPVSYTHLAIGSFNYVKFLWIKGGLFCYLTNKNNFTEAFYQY